MCILFTPLILIQCGFSKFQVVFTPPVFRARNSCLQTRKMRVEYSVLRVENIGTRKKLRVRYFI